MKAKRQNWFDTQDMLDPACLIFLDECGTNTKMASLYGRSKRGTRRCRASIPHGHWHTTTVIAGLTTKGIIAPMTLKGAIDGEIVHSLYKNLAGARIDRAVEAKQAIEAKGANMLFLPPYSPDFNPIEKAINQIKMYLKTVAARTKEQLDEAVAKSVDIVTPQNAINYFEACGYNCDPI